MIEGVVEKEISNAVDAFVENEDALEEYQEIYYQLIMERFLLIDLIHLI